MVERPKRCLFCEARLKNPICQLPAPSVIQFSKAAVTTEFQPGQRIFEQGDRSGEVFLIRSGKVKLMHEHSEGAVQILRIAGPGETLGVGMSLGPYLLATAVARGNVSVCRLRLSALEGIAEKDPSFALAWAHLLMDEIRRAREAVFHLGPHPAAIRLARFLCDALEAPAPRDAAQKPAVISLTHAEVAASLAIAPETATRLLRDLEEKHILRLQRGRFEVIDLDRLLAIAGYPGLSADAMTLEG